jgi:hypothetical protein
MKVFATPLTFCGRSGWHFWRWQCSNYLSKYTALLVIVFPASSYPKQIDNKLWSSFRHYRLWLFECRVEFPQSTSNKATQEKTTGEGHQLPHICSMLKSNIYQTNIYQYIKHKKECFIWYPNTEKWVEKTRRTM